MKKISPVIAVIALLASCSTNDNQNTEDMSTENHYTFQLSDNVRREKVHFKNRFGIELTADLYLPTSLKEGDSISVL